MDCLDKIVLIINQKEDQSVINRLSDIGVRWKAGQLFNDYFPDRDIYTFLFLTKKCDRLDNIDDLPCYLKIPLSKIIILDAHLISIFALKSNNMEQFRNLINTFEPALKLLSLKEYRGIKFKDLRK